MPECSCSLQTTVTKPLIVSDSHWLCRWGRFFQKPKLQGNFHFRFPENGSEDLLILCFAFMSLERWNQPEHEETRHPRCKFLNLLRTYVGSVHERTPGVHRGSQRNIQFRFRTVSPVRPDFAFSATKFISPANTHWTQDRVFFSKLEMVSCSFVVSAPFVIFWKGRPSISLQNTRCQ